MSEFEVGQKVKVITWDDTEHFEEIGELIEDMGETIHPYLVKFSNGDVEDFGADELAHATEQPATAPSGGGEARSLPQRYRDEREAAQERGETIRDYTSWLETQVRSAEFDRSMFIKRNDENTKHMLFMGNEIDKDFQRIGDLLGLDGKFKRDYGTNKIVEQLATLRDQLAAAEATAAGLRRERDAASEAYNKGWNGATQSMLSILERTLETAPVNKRISAIETLMQHFRVDYPNAADAKPAGGA